MNCATGSIAAGRRRWWRRRTRSRNSPASAAKIWCASSSARRRARRLAAVRAGGRRLRDVHARRTDQRRRPDAAVFHLGHDGKTKAGAAQPAQLSRRPSVDHVLARPAAGRRASQHLLAGLGQARLELLLRALECRRHRVRRQPAALRCQGPAGDHRPLRRHHALRAADGVAAVHPGEACDLQGQLARGLRRRRAAQSRSHRSGAARPGASPSATATARPKPPRSPAIRRARRSRSARWAARCRAIACRSPMLDGQSDARRAR